MTSHLIVQKDIICLNAWLHEAQDLGKESGLSEQNEGIV